MSSETLLFIFSVIPVILQQVVSVQQHRIVTGWDGSSDFCSTTLGNVWYPAIMNSSEEVTEVGNFATQTGDCPGFLVGIAGSRQAEATGTFTFDQYVASSTTRMVTINISPLGEPSLLHLPFNVDCLACETDIEIEKLTFSSTHAEYQLLTSHSRFIGYDYPYWVSRCSEIENGWSSTTLRNEVQKEFLKAAMAYVVLRNWTYYIGGSNYHSGENNDVTPFRYCASDFSIDDPETSHVIITNINKDVSPQFQALSPAQDELMGVLCEKGTSGNDFEFSSVNSIYVKIVSDTLLDFSTFAANCSRMGSGWGPAVLNDQMELEFIKQAQKGFSDIKSYWIGGSTNAAPFQYFEFNAYIMGDSGTNPVIVSLFTEETRNNVNNFRLRARPPGDTRRSILCEKAKV